MSMDTTMMVLETPSFYLINGWVENYAYNRFNIGIEWGIGSISSLPIVYFYSTTVVLANQLVS